MPYVVKTSAFYEDVISWLQTNVGDLLWSRPIIEWKGRGWTMNALGGTMSKESGFLYLIRIDDKELATICALTWT
jgi:hypothetical protein